MGNKLFGVDIAKIVLGAIGPGVLPATLTKITPGTRTTGRLSAGTNPTSVSYPCRGFVDSVARKYRGGELVDDRTVRIILLGDSIAAGTVAPAAGDHVTIEGVDWVIEGGIGRESAVLDRDPAGATYSFTARKL